MDLDSNLPLFWCGVVWCAVLCGAQVKNGDDDCDEHARWLIVVDIFPFGSFLSLGIYPGRVSHCIATRAREWI